MIGKSDDGFDAAEPALIVTYGNTAKKERRLHRQVTVLGKARGCDIGLVAPDVSNVHCVIVRVGEGFHVRDCGSRSGTRLNGEEIEEAVLYDGAILQIGPFSFRVYLPARPAATPAGAKTPEQIQRLEGSRRRLARFALTLRHRLREQRSNIPPKITAEAGPATRQAALDRQAAMLAEQIRDYEQRARRLELAERDLTCDRETLDYEFAALQARLAQSEQDLARREAEVDAAIRTRWEQFQRYLGAAQGELQQGPGEPRPPLPEEVLQRREPGHGDWGSLARPFKPPHSGSGSRKVPR